MNNNYLLVDGYNIIFAWDKLKKLADDNLDHAREKLINILSNYQGVKKCEIIIVFDAYMVKGGAGSVIRQGNVYVVYTKEAETADSYIERTTALLSKNEDVLPFAKHGDDAPKVKNSIRVATSDGLEQVIIMSQGAVRVSAGELYEEVRLAKQHIRGHIERQRPVKNNMLIDNLDPEAAEWLENLRREK
ncbi:MAG: NYN domain-containing protein [Firmicutes bacterium]|nr:NYN domain-containing protein [Bacillota bacterium]